MHIVPSVLDCGSCLVGNSKVWSTQCTNFGGEGKFKLLLPDKSEQDDMDTVSSILLYDTYVLQPSRKIKAYFHSMHKPIASLFNKAIKGVRV